MKSVTRMKPGLPELGVFIFGLVVFLLGVREQFTLITTARYAVFALTMHHEGFSFFPNLYGFHPYPDYTATQTWLAALCMWVFHSTANCVIVLPNAIVGAVLLVQIYCLAGLHNKRWGLLAVLLAVVTVELYAQAASLGEDIFIASSACAAFHCAYSAKLVNKPRRLCWLPLIIVYGFAFRGLLGAALTFAPVFLFYLLERDYKALCKWAVIAILTSVLAFVVLLFFAYLQGGASFLHQVWFMQFVGRFLPQAGHGTPSIMHYFNHVLSHYSISVLVALIVFVGIFPRLLNHALTAEQRFLRHLVAWALVVTVLLAIPDSRRARYILAVAPALAIIAAYLFVVIKPNLWLRFWRGFLAALALFFPFILLVAMGILFYQQKLPDALHGELILAVLVVLSFCGFSVAVFISRYTDKEVAAIAVFALSFIVMYALVANPLFVAHTGSKPFAKALNHARKPGQTIVFYQMPFDNNDIRIVANTRPFFTPVFIRTKQQLLAYPHALVVAPSQTAIAEIKENR